MINFLFKWNSISLHIFIFKTTWKSYFKNNEKIPGNLLKNHGDIMEFCQFEKVGTLVRILVRFVWPLNSGPIFFTLMQSSGNIWPNNRLELPKKVDVPSGKSWIRLCRIPMVRTWGQRFKANGYPLKAFVCTTGYDWTSRLAGWRAYCTQEVILRLSRRIDYPLSSWKWRFPIDNFEFKWKLLMETLDYCQGMLNTRPGVPHHLSAMFLVWC